MLFDMASLPYPRNDKKIDLIGDGFDAALPIAALEDSSLMANRLAPFGASSFQNRLQ